MTRPRAEIFASRARRLAAYERGEKVDYIAALHNVTPTLVSHYASVAGISRRGRKAQA
jgi:hypothetical protein